MALNGIDWALKYNRIARWDLMKRSSDVYREAYQPRICQECGFIGMNYHFEKGKRGRRKICRKCKCQRDQMRRYQKKHAN